MEDLRTSDQGVPELISKLRDWPRVEIGNYDSYEGARLVAVEQRLALGQGNDAPGRDNGLQPPRVQFGHRSLHGAFRR